MQTDRGLQAAVGIVLAFSMLWTVAILIPDKSVSAGSLGFTVDRTSGGAKVIHAATPRIYQRVSGSVLDLNQARGCCFCLILALSWSTCSSRNLSLVLIRSPPDFPQCKLGYFSSPPGPLQQKRNQSQHLNKAKTKKLGSPSFQRMFGIWLRCFSTRLAISYRNESGRLLITTTSHFLESRAWIRLCNIVVSSLRIPMMTSLVWTILIMDLHRGGLLS